MKYLLMVYQDEKKTLDMPKEDLTAVRAEYQAFVDDLKKKSQLLWNQGLQPTSAATTVRVREGKLSATDGPFAETKEQLGGEFLIEAKDLNVAIEVAGKIPSARWGSIEVRPPWNSEGNGGRGWILLRDREGPRRSPGPLGAGFGGGRRGYLRSWMGT